MSWGISNNTPYELVQLHLFLSDKLSTLSWERSQIWSGKISAHSWVPLPGLELAFDVTLANGALSAMLVVRDPQRVEEVSASLMKEGISFSTTSRHPNRLNLFELPYSADTSIPKLAQQAAADILKTREALAASLRQEHRWRDSATGVQIPFTVKPERKGNPALIFLFTSIRSKQHWIDFGGAQGASVQPNRARIVFLLDEFSAHYSYHLALGGDTAIFDATLRFIEAYVAEHAYSWDNVALAGMSKGGTTALAIGQRLPQCEAYVVAPQLALGDYLEKNRPQILRTITGISNHVASKRADNILWNALECPRATSGITRCMLFTSEHDEHCTSQLDRLAQALDIGDKFEVLVDRSKYTGSHMKTVRFHAPSLLHAIGMFGIRAASA